MNKLNFRRDSGNDFYKILHKKVSDSFAGRAIYADTKMWLKVIFYFSFFVLTYSLLFFTGENAMVFTILFLVNGLLMLGIIFNIAHDAAHNTLSHRKKLNKILYYTSFTLLGNNPFVWKKYHIESHHLYTNVEGSDIDVIKNAFIRLNKDDACKSHHRYQHYYAPLLYIFYSLNFVILRDIAALFGRKDRTIVLALPLREKRVYIFYKVIYFSYTLILPLLFCAPHWKIIIGAFFLSHFLNSLIICSVLACNHQVDETSHTSPPEKGKLDKSWASLQMEANLDYNPESKLLNFLVGGFNAHTVHHLFPGICHIHYPKLISIIRKTASEHGIHYNETTYLKAMRSHFRFLEKMGVQTKTESHETAIQQETDGRKILERPFR
ncbi:MAG: acyl-CoA desaturase [Bacteroidota bacterium]|nr:acyl-CoA desaturase [Bacteroidota bacterium]